MNYTVWFLTKTGDRMQWFRKGIGQHFKREQDAIDFIESMLSTDRMNYAFVRDNSSWEQRRFRKVDHSHIQEF